MKTTLSITSLIKTTSLLSISVFFLSINSNLNANEMTTSSWNFPTPDQIQVSQNRVMLFCDANPYKCPVGLRAARAGGSGGVGATAGTGSLVSPTSNSSANNISVVLAGDNSSITLSTDQQADDNNMTSNSESDPTIDLDQVLNYTNHYK
jgi:hypothetical protein